MYQDESIYQYLEDGGSLPCIDPEEEYRDPEEEEIREREYDKKMELEAKKALSDLLLANGAYDENVKLLPYRFFEECETIPGQALASVHFLFHGDGECDWFSRVIRESFFHVIFTEQQGNEFFVALILNEKQSIDDVINLSRMIHPMFKEPVPNHPYDVYAIEKRNVNGTRFDFRVFKDEYLMDFCDRDEMIANIPLFNVTFCSDEAEGSRENEKERE